ncbi:SDR family NAD(P)-dependent oxidoreductase [Microcella pacifica]|uniref:SDR family NAD(P)-dependent oxidoreductase n=1 Tax=Microcella pacifica TaxID=2591847 RepID=A0A9E5JMH2_9MICO|nr:SDR family NAD(P)-dependent oxidoreductase [Microcella pacifica]NHF62127.1 SDR family NAD(P)-dependent oxidoreductase [Microcella pacifica]
MPRQTVTVVTGASTGIGRAVALRQARAGDRVWALVRDPAACAEIENTAQHEGLALHLVAGDVTDDASTAAAFKHILDVSGHVDRLISNAGAYLGAPFESMTVDELRGVFEVNYFGALRCVSHVLPGMRRAGGGIIIAVSSQSSEAIFPTWTAYAGSKRALEASLESLALEVASLGIRIAIVQPGITATAMRTKIQPRSNPPAYDALLQRYRTIIAADRGDSMEPDDVAQAIQRTIEDAQSPWRVRVGRDAQRNIDMRQAAGDEQWISLFGATSDDTFFAAWTALSGSPDPRDRADESLADPH